MTVDPLLQGVAVDIADCVTQVFSRSFDRIDLDSSFIANGGDSLKAILLQSMIRSRGYTVAREDLLTSHSLGQTLRSALHEPWTIDDGPSGLPLSTISSANSQAENDCSLPDSPVSLASEVTTHSQNLEQPARQKTATELDSGPDPASATAHAPLSSPGDSFTTVSELLTEMQLSLVHETITHCGTNVIRYTEFHRPENAELFHNAWLEVLSGESIFKNPWFAPLLSTTGQVLQNNDSGLSLDAPATTHGEWPGFSLDASSSATSDFGAELVTLTLKIHHAFIDAYSLGVLLAKVREKVNGGTIKAGPSFWAWAQLLRQHQATSKAEGDQYWTDVLARHPGCKGQFLVPEPAAAPDRGSKIETICFTADTTAIETAARQAEVTPASLFYAGWALIVATYADSDEVVFGSVLSGRGLRIPGSLDTIGPLINVLPFHVSILRSSPTQDFLRGLFRDLVDLEGFVWTTSENGFQRDYESALSVEMNLPEEETWPLAPIKHSVSQRSQVPISITVKNLSAVTLEFHSSRFGLRAARAIADCYERVLDMVVAPSGTVGGIMQGLLSCPDYSQLMRWGNCISGLTTRPSVKDDLVTLFETAVEANPNATAIEKGDKAITYDELRDRAIAIASALAATTSIGKGDVVCVHSDRSINWICAIWGVLRAGCTYCSLDPQLPETLRERMVEAVSCAAFITVTDEQLIAWAPQSVCLAFSVESVLSSGDAERVLAPWTPDPHQPAYICFTSGSTGVPKPVVCTHAGLVAFQQDLTVRLKAGAGVRVSQIMSVAFDGSIHEIFSSLTYGATLVLPATPHDIPGVLEQVNSAILTPSLARALRPRDFPKLETVYLVGEPVPQAVADEWAATKVVYNMYGPTEATCGATIKLLQRGEKVTIGRPNPSTRVYVLNAKDGLAHPGMVGRIHLAGVQVSQGYRGMRDQTQKVFRPDPIMGNGELCYNTGDLGYWDERGELVCVGRSDRQLKLRGYRIDLDDLAIRIARAVPAVNAVAVVLRSDVMDELLAMVQPATLNVASVRSRLESALPRYAMPAHIVAVDTLPMTSTGKIDYKAIALVDISLLDRSVSSLATATERAVAAAFSDVLGNPHSWKLSDLDRHQTFGQLGGHSMEQIRLARHLTKTLGIPVSLTMVISNTSIQALARAIDQAASAGVLAETPSSMAMAPAVENVTPIEIDWLDKSTVSGGTSSFNVSSLYRIEPGEIDADRLAMAVNLTLQRHAVFRSTYQTSRAFGRSRYRRTLIPCSPRVQRLGEFDVWAELNRPFQLHNEHPVRAFISPDKLLIVMSHVVADYTTLAMVLRELSAVYVGAAMPPVRALYPDPQLFGTSLTEDVRQYWQTVLENSPRLPQLMSGSPQRTSYCGRSVIYKFGSGASRQILACPLSHSVSLQHLGMAAVILGLLDDECDEPKEEVDVILGVPFLNRGSSEQMETAGLFLQPLPVRVKHDWTAGHGSTFLECVQQSTQSALANGVPWHKLMELTHSQPDYPDHPLFDVMVTFHEPQMVQRLQPDLPGLESCLAWSSGAKFKIMCEFTAVADDCLMLRVEYDNRCIQDDLLHRFVDNVVWGIESLSSPVTSTAATQQQADRPSRELVKGEVLVGKTLRELSSVGLWDSCEAASRCRVY